MADELAYGTSKRKYEESPPPQRRASGFSSPPSGPGVYNAVPPPMNEIELAKQKAQEIAARLLNNADPSKRARVENGGGGSYDSSEASYGYGQKAMGSGFGGPPLGESYGYSGPSKKIEIPNGKVGVIIGKGGETIKYLQMQSGAKIQVTRDMDADPNSSTREVELTGTPDQIAKAEQLIGDVLAEAEASGPGGSRRMAAPPPAPGAEQFVMKVPNNKVGLVIGKGGETIRNIQANTGARVQVIPLHLPPGDTSRERTVQLDGTSEQIEAAKQMVFEVTSENRMRNPSMSGGYSMQQGGYQPRPPTSWAPPGPPPMHQPGYGYGQPGAYNGPPQQYGMNQPPYSGYPPQPTSGGYSSGWDQSSAQNQPPSQGGGYDYYNQQQPTQQPPTHTGSADASGYGYGQASAYSQGQAYGYGQDGYGGYQSQSAYGQNPSTDQQQQGYASTYGNASNPTPEGGQQAHGDANQAPAPGQTAGQPSPKPNHPPQVSGQQAPYGVPPSSQGGYGATQPPPSYASYGTAPPQKPADQSAYGQSPSAQGGYAQGGYPYSQPPQAGYYGQQTDQKYPYPTPQDGYGAPPSYGQQPPQPYSSNAYGGGYAQPSAYPSSDVGNARGGASDATPPKSSSQAGETPAKSSPPS